MMQSAGLSMRSMSPHRIWLFLAVLTVCSGSAGAAAPARSGELVASTIQRYCIGCHNAKIKTAGLALDGLKPAEAPQQSPVWEKVIRRLRVRSMPPAGLPRPDEATYEAVLGTLESILDRADEASPDPGRTDAFRRLNRTEYQNAIRDLLGVELDVSSLLPADGAGHGFDNVTVSDLSPTLLERYVHAARKVSRLAVGLAPRSPAGELITLPPDLTQEQHFEGFPLGTRGGAAFNYTFPVDGHYEVQVRLARDRNEHVEGLYEPHELEVILDGKPLERFLITPPAKDQDHDRVDQHLKARVAVSAGPHRLMATFVKKPWLLLESERQPYEAHFNMDRHPRVQPAVLALSIAGPFEARGPGLSPSRQRIFVCYPAQPSEEEPCARRIVGRLARLAWRRPVSNADLETPLKFFHQGRKEGSFDHGIELALRSILVSPEFLFRIERDPPGVARHTAYRVTDLELVSRLSFFLWSSIPDAELLDAAEAGRLHDPAELERQVRRMLQDGRSSSLVTNFAGQWLHLRNLASAAPDLRLFPDFDDNLRQAFRRETELFFEHILRQDRSIVELLRANYTFLNERLAKHYGIPHIYGSRFRKVELGAEVPRGGLLRQGSVLTVTSYATRTSPVIRGKWILDNILGVPPPPPPPFVPALKEKSSTGQKLTVRERLAEHRANPACSGCHQLMDPPGFALENYDAIGRWRSMEDGRPLDVSGGLPDGSKFSGVQGLEEALLRRPEVFAVTLTEKLLTYALGRGVEDYDAPAVRAIVREARQNDYRFSSLILGIVKSRPFQMRRSS